MVSADNLNLDCLELVFAYLSGNDLVSVSLVSRSFLSGVIPFLYRTVTYHLGNAKHKPPIVTPFEAIVRHPALAVHVHNIDIRIVPLATGKSTIQPKFMASLLQAIELCTNLRSFTCTPNVLPPLLAPLKEHENLEALRVNATLTPQQSKLLTEYNKLKSLALDACTWNVVDALPEWGSKLGRTLTSLTLNNIHDLNDTILEALLPTLPKLAELHIIGCQKIEHGHILRALQHVPHLESLSLTCWDSAVLPPDIQHLCSLRHLTIDTYLSPVLGAPEHAPPLWPSMIAVTRSWSCPLTSINLRMTERLPVTRPFINELLDAHAATLRYIGLINCDVAADSVAAIASRCRQLKRLSVTVPNRDLEAFTIALSRSQSLEILSDIADSHGSHGPQAFATRSNVRAIMECVPSLRVVVTSGRVWKCDKSANWRRDSLSISLERRRNIRPPYWFLTDHTSIH